MHKNYFKGYYFKHQKNNETAALIPGVANSSAFLQVITNKQSLSLKYKTISFDKVIKIGNCKFSKKGIYINTHNIQGKIIYSELTPIKYDIMGPFKFFPLECKHTIISMHHKLNGYLKIDGINYNFNNGVGYIEKDSGYSFPKKYFWLQCNDFLPKCSVIASVADIPFMGFKFWGCICVVFYKEKEYRFATYLGVKIICCNKNKLVLKQGRYQLEINIQSKNAHALLAPYKGKMTSIIRESNCSAANFKMYVNNNLLFDLDSENVSFEYNM